MGTKHQPDLLSKALRELTKHNMLLFIHGDWRHKYQCQRHEEKRYLLSHIHFQPGFHDAACKLVSFCISGYFYMGYQHGSLQLHSTSEPCSWYFPCQDWDSGVHWDDFGDDLVHFSRAADQELIHIVRCLSFGDRYEWWDQVYFFGLVLLCDVSETPVLVMLGWLWWPMLICSVSL